MSELYFDPDKHMYMLDDQILPSVTQIMQPLSAVRYKGIDDAIMKAAAEKGTIVHETLQNFVDYGIKDIPEELHGYYDAFKKWWDARKPIAIATELKTYHVIMLYAGTVDLICDIDGKRTLVDYKTTSSVSDKMCSVQLEAYAQALRTHNIIIEQKMILHLQKDGTYTEHTYPIRDAERWRIFSALKTIYDYSRK